MRTVYWHGCGMGMGMGMGTRTRTRGLQEKREKIWGIDRTRSPEHPLYQRLKNPCSISLNAGIQREHPFNRILRVNDVGRLGPDHNPTPGAFSALPSTLKRA